MREFGRIAHQHGHLVTLCQCAIHDEAAKYKANEKGSPFRQAAARVKGFYNSKLIYFSTPTDASQENEFNAIWEQSNKQLFGVPCPGCGARIVYAFDETPGSLPTTSDTPRAILKWQEGLPFKTDDGRKIRRADAAWFECLACGYQINDTERHRSVKQGEFFPTQEHRAPQNLRRHSSCSESRPSKDNCEVHRACWSATLFSSSGSLARHKPYVILPHTIERTSSLKTRSLSQQLIIIGIYSSVTSNHVG